MNSQIPRPGQHLPGQHGGEPAMADPARVRADVAELLQQLDGAQIPGELPQRARILEQAHDVLVQALATVDKI